MTDKQNQLPWARSCAHCLQPLALLEVKRGRIPKYCSARCRVTAHRRAKGVKPRGKRAEK